MSAHPAPDHQARLELALEVLDGLSVGDALGESLSYGFYRAREHADFSAYRDGSVRYTDDTEMALGIVDVLTKIQSVEEDLLAWTFASRFHRDPDRGYGRMARRLLMEISAGADWRQVSESAFGGGSFGNGAAMRVAPLGAYLADDPSAIPAAARCSARVTHFHPEGIAGAIAVAIATGVAVALRGQAVESAVEGIFEAVLSATPGGEVRRRLEIAAGSPRSEPGEIARQLGNGTEISAQDTVPFCIWNACRCLSDYREAVLSTVEVGGDCDTNAAIVGGIVAGFVGRPGIPKDWLRVREALKFGAQ